MRRAAANLMAMAVACAMVAMIAGLSITGHWPGHAGLDVFVPDGIMTVSPGDVARVEVTTREGQTVFVRGAGGWHPSGQRNGRDAGELSGHVEAGLGFLRVSPPLRKLVGDEYNPADLASFGLEPPAMAISLTGARGELGRVEFGAASPAGTSQYVRVAGRPGIYLMARHVGAEWQLATDRAARLGRGSLLLPVSLAQIWAVEIVAGGQLTRFERDNRGQWFHHFGQHVHVGLADAHMADPVRAPLIAAELAALDQAQAEPIASGAAPGQIEASGLLRPNLILLLYARDNSSPVSRIEIGGPTADGTHLFARSREDPGVLAMDRAEIGHFDRLLQLADESKR
jgi:hypothetical protein